MTEPVRFEAEVVTFDPRGFVDHYSGSYAVHGQSVLQVTSPGAMQHRYVTVVIDETSERLAALRRPGTRVSLTLDPASLDLNVMFSGAVLDVRVEPGDQETEG